MKLHSSFAHTKICDINLNQPKKLMNKKKLQKKTHTHTQVEPGQDSWKKPEAVETDLDSTHSHTKQSSHGLTLRPMSFVSFKNKNMMPSRSKWLFNCVIQVLDNGLMNGGHYTIECLSNLRGVLQAMKTSPSAKTHAIFTPPNQPRHTHTVHTDMFIEK